jgi:hypothetical protein
MEFVLAVARLVGEEHNFIQLQRRVAAEPGTGLSQEVTRLKGRLSRAHVTTTEMKVALDAAAEALAQEAVEEGVGLLCTALAMLPQDQLGGTCGLVVQDSVAQMGKLGPERMEYVVLALHGLECGLEDG